MTTSNSPANEALAQQALVFFNAQKYKEATDAYKTLLKSQKNQDWQANLALCYWFRAKAMGDKGMLKEAVVLWENYAELADAPLDYLDFYLAWLFATKNDQKVKAALGRLSAEDLDGRYPALAAALGLLVLTDKPEWQALLPPASAFMAHLLLAQDALAAYRDGKPDALTAALKQLPFRSAFRDFRAVLNASVLLADAPVEAQSALAKISASSPYFPAAQAVLAYLADDGDLLTAMTALSPKPRKVVADAKGFGKKQFDLLETLFKQSPPWSDKLKFNLAIQQQAVFGVDAARQFCFASLGAYPDGRKDFVRVFGKPDEFEENRVLALYHELNESEHDAEYYWRQCLKLLLRQEPQDTAKIAMLQRHIALLAGPTKEGIQLFMDSLELDPADKDSYLKILLYYDQLEPDPAHYKAWLERSLTALPNDVELLALAIKTARRNKAFKKAASYAETLLAVDPVNTLAKQLLFSSHLAHARRLLKGEKFHLVTKELDSAEQLNIQKRWQVQAQLLRGFFQYLAEDKNQGLAVLAEALEKSGMDNACAHFQLAMEAQLLELPLATFLKILPSCKDQLLSEAALEQLLALIKHYLGQGVDGKILHTALDKIKAPLKQTLKLQGAKEALHLALTEIFAELGHFEFLRVCAKSGHNQWLKPIWVYYKIYAECNGDASKLESMAMYTLQCNLDRAHKEGDLRAASLTEQFLQRHYAATQPLDLARRNEVSDSPDDEVDIMIENLFGHLPDAMLTKIMDRGYQITKKILPEQALLDFTKKLQVPRDSHELAPLLGEIDFIYALMIFRSAAEMGIDTGVSPDDILAYFA
jgi:hypothetical protein